MNHPSIVCQPGFMQCLQTCSDYRAYIYLYWSSSSYYYHCFISSVVSNLIIFKLGTSTSTLEFWIYLHIRPFSRQLPHHRLKRSIPRETVDDEHSKTAFKQVLNPTFLLQTTSKSDSQAITVQATFLTDCFNHSFPSSNLSSLSYLLCASLQSCTCVNRNDFVLVSTFTPSLLDVCTPFPKRNAP